MLHEVILREVLKVALVPVMTKLLDGLSTVVSDFFTDLNVKLQKFVEDKQDEYEEIVNEQAKQDAL